MGIDLYSGDKTFGCSYSTWNNIRIELIEATFKYIEQYFDSGKIQEGTNEYVSLNQLKQYIETIQNEKIMKQTFIGKQSNLLDLFYSYSKNLDFIDLLIQFGVSGIYAFCVKSDCEGFYSVGNSYDICELLSVIKPFLLKNKDNLDSEENWLYMWIDELTDVFKSSIENKVIVTIC